MFAIERDMVDGFDCFVIESVNPISVGKLIDFFLP